MACAEQAREAFGLDAVVFVPAGSPVYKKHQKVTCAKRRLEMCRLAVESNPAFDVSALEIERGGDTYTVDTLRELRAHYPDNVELFFITGADAVANIVRWRESRAVAGLSRFIAVTRPGFELGGRRAFARWRAKRLLHRLPGGDGLGHIVERLAGHGWRRASPSATSPWGA